MAAMQRRMPAAALATAILVLLCSCGTRPVGFGVVLWGEVSGAPQTGAVVAIVQESPVNSSYLISLPGEKEPREYSMGRIRLFRKKADADGFASVYSATAGSWAVVTKQDPPPLPIRDSASQDGKGVYKLQKNQLVKVVSRSAEKTVVKPYTDFWYEVVTEDGYGGWAFGHFLRPFVASGDPGAEARRILSQDETLDTIMGTTWRPDWFLDMIGRGAIDLAMLRDDVGLFPSPSEKLMRLVLPLSTFEFHYTGEPQKVGVSSYAFPGTDLRIDVLDPDAQRINVSYRYKDQPVSRIYVVMKDDVSAVVAAEQKRRADLFDGLQKRGTTLTSSAYGTVRLLDGMRFSWEGFGKLVPSLIGTAAKGQGTIDFPLHVGKTLTATFDGVITFVFDEYPDNGVSFLYKEAADGLRLTSLGRDSVQDLIVTQTSFSPVVMFFNQSP